MDSINKLINIFRDFPAVGPRTAQRFVYYLTKLPKEKIDEFTSAIQEIKNKIKLCEFCFNPFEPQSEDKKLCPICSNSSRNKNLLCVVEKEADLLSIESTKKYSGLYFILGGTIAVIKNHDNNGPRIEELKRRIQNPPDRQAENTFSEIIIALNPTPEGKATSILIEREIKKISKMPGPKITHLAQGIPVGGELEYADEETLESALEGRK